MPLRQSPFPRLPPWSRWTLAQVRLVRELRAAGATHPETAQFLSAWAETDVVALDQLEARGVIRQSSPGFYYLDEAAAWRKGVTWILLWLGAAVVVVAFIKSLVDRIL